MLRVRVEWSGRRVGDGGGGGHGTSFKNGDTETRRWGSMVGTAETGRAAGAGRDASDRKSERH